MNLVVASVMLYLSCHSTLPLKPIWPISISRRENVTTTFPVPLACFGLLPRDVASLQDLLKDVVGSSGGFVAYQYDACEQELPHASVQYILGIFSRSSKWMLYESLCSYVTACFEAIIYDRTDRPSLLLILPYVQSEAETRRIAVAVENIRDRFVVGCKSIDGIDKIEVCV
jgi:hypothetical protein